MKLPRRFGLLSQLLTGFAVGGIIVAILLFLGDQMLRQTSSHLDNMLEEHVRPLARLHRLQSRIAVLRNLELELTKLQDVFVVQTHVTKLREEMDVVDSDLSGFSTRLAVFSPADNDRLAVHWREYRTRLMEQIRLAREMDMAAVEREASAGSQSHFTAIQVLLAEVATKTEAAADRAYRNTTNELAAQRSAFLMLVMLGTTVMVIGLAWSGRVVVRRVRALHEHARRLALGEDSGHIDISKYDEIGDLATAFVSMREQVLSREAALRAAQLELEDRVEARTRDLRRTNARLILFSQTVEQNPVGILIADIDGKVEYVNGAYAQITGQPISAVVGKPLVALVEDGKGLDMEAAVKIAMAGERTWEVERRSQRADGVDYWERLNLAVVNDENGSPAHLLLSREDITERHAQQEKIAYQAHFDALTGLPNRVLAQDRLVQKMELSRRQGDRAAVMYIDLDNFKQINDTLGHITGDGLLRQAAARLQTLVRSEDTVARLGGDEFLVIAGRLGHGDEASVVAEKIIAAFGTPFQVDEHELVTSPSIGIAVYPDDGTDPMELLRNADLAMYESKGGGRNTYRFFDERMNAEAQERLRLLRGLRGALERNEFVLHFQPQIDLATGLVIGAEALIRWRHPELGLVPPGRFIPIAEDSGLITPIGKWVLREACRQTVAWQKQDLPPIVMAVNLSAVQFRSPDIYETILGALQESGLDPSRLELELTESILIRDTDSVLETTKRLKKLGIQLSVDDFGTGYSSLSYLKRFPVDKLKVDRSFVRDMANDTEDAALVNAIVQMAKVLGLKTIAEGVENHPVLDHLRICNCDEAQGYLFGHPMPAEEFEAYLRNPSVFPWARSAPC